MSGSLRWPKKKAEAKFNVSQEIRTVLADNPNFTGKEAIAAVQAKHPVVAINESSASVAFTTARKKLGIPGGRADRRQKVRRSVRGLIEIQFCRRSS